jgi:hypothetical protein
MLRCKACQDRQVLLAQLVPQAFRVHLDRRENQDFLARLATMASQGYQVLLAFGVRKVTPDPSGRSAILASLGHRALKACQDFLENPEFPVNG